MVNVHVGHNDKPSAVASTHLSIPPMSSPSTDASELAENTSLSEYEQSRARNIEKNNARLRALGLISAAEERLSTDSAWGRSPIERSKDDDANEVPFSSDEEYCDEEDCVSSKRKKMDKTALPPREGSLKSRRILNLPTEHGDSIINGNNSEEGATEKSERVHQKRAALVAECRDARQRAANEVEKAGVKMAGKDNPTATYEHCLMRVRSMTEKGLINRVSWFVADVICKSDRCVCTSYITTLFACSDPNDRKSCRKALRSKDGNLQVMLARGRYVGAGKVCI